MSRTLCPPPPSSCLHSNRIASHRINPLRPTPRDRLASDMANFIKETLEKVPGVDPRIVQRTETFSGMNQGEREPRDCSDRHVPGTTSAPASFTCLHSSCFPWAPSPLPPSSPSTTQAQLPTLPGSLAWYSPRIRSTTARTSESTVGGVSSCGYASFLTDLSI